MTPRANATSASSFVHVGVREHIQPLGARRTGVLSALRQLSRGELADTGGCHSGARVADAWRLTTALGWHAVKG